MSLTNTRTHHTGSRGFREDAIPPILLQALEKDLRSRETGRELPALSRLDAKLRVRSRLHLAYQAVRAHESVSAHAPGSCAGFARHHPPSFLLASVRRHVSVAATCPGSPCSDGNALAAVDPHQLQSHHGALSAQYRLSARAHITPKICTLTLRVGIMHPCGQCPQVFAVCTLVANSIPLQ